MFRRTLNSTAIKNLLFILAVIAETAVLWGLGILLLLGMGGMLWLQIRNRRQIIRLASEPRKKDKLLVQTPGEAFSEHILTSNQHLLLEILHQLISQLGPGTQWQSLLEVISEEVLKLPGVVAVEIGSREGDQLLLEGFDQQKGERYTTQIPFDPTTSLSCHCLSDGVARIFSTQTKEQESSLAQADPRLQDYEAAISIPFSPPDKIAILSLYSNQANALDETTLKAMQILTTQLENIL